MMLDFRFQVRNPKANSAQVYVYFSEVIKWHKLEKFQ